VKIISWNVNGIRSCSSKGLLEFLESEKPDVFCAQEVKAFSEQSRDLGGKFPEVREFWHSAQRPGYSGVASFFWCSPDSEKKGMGVKDFDSEGRVLVSYFKKFTLINAYFPNGAASDERHLFKMKFLDDILRFLKKESKKKPVVLTGDLNIAHRPIDIHDPVRLDGTSGFKPEERVWIDSLLGAGFVDAYRHFHSDQADQYTWWSYRSLARQRNKGWRIDYFIVSESFIGEIKKVSLRQEVGGSDHCPLILEF